ncbi:MAG TPA: hypothetical protein VJT68_04475, partial [Thermoleophilaceae bacterium]|nr:hypothetical protein [Thermoleophilaceae bacterium]
AAAGGGGGSGDGGDHNPHNDPPSKRVERYIAKHGLADEIADLTERLNRTGLSETARLLLAQKDVYGQLILDAIKREHVPRDDVGALFESITRNAEDDALENFQGALVAEVFKRNHIDFRRKPEQYEDVLRRVRDEGISLYTGTAEQRILKIGREVAQVSDLPAMIREWAGDEAGVHGHRLEPRVVQAMVGSLQNLDVDFAHLDKDQRYRYFTVAYARATATGGATADPIALTSTPGDFSAWDFRVDTFEAAQEQGVVPENIRAAGALDYVYCLGDVLGVFKIADALVLRWAAGLVDIQDVDTSSQLYRYWQRREQRQAPEDRGALYKRVLNKGDAEVLSRMVVNEAFPGLWHSLMSSVADYIRDATDAAQQGSVSRIPIYRATQSLQNNLSEYMTGMAPLQVTDMYMQLREAFDILGAPEIVAQLSSGRHGRGVWAVIDRLGKEELGQSIDVGTIRTLAVEGNRVFQWIADFDRGTVTESQFEQARDAAEAWIIAASGLEGAGTTNGSAPDDWAGDEEDPDFDMDMPDDSELAW